MQNNNDSRLSIDTDNSVCFGTIDDNLFDESTLPEVRAIDKLRIVCAKRAKQHALRAKQLRFFHYTISCLLLLTNTASAVIAAINASLKFRDASISVTVLSTLAASVASVNVIFQPVSRKREHLDAELRYKNLGRDLSVKLAIYDKNQIVSTDSYWAGILRDTQRNLDNIQASEPTL